MNRDRYLRASSQVKQLKLNEAANLMMSSMDMMQESGSASGLKVIWNLYQKCPQQGLNKHLQMQMGMGMQNQQGMMQRLGTTTITAGLQDLLSENLRQSVV